MNYPPACRLKANRAIKVIRVRDVSSLEPLMQQGVKVIQLIRDPRATDHSRASFRKGDPFLDTIKDYCDEHMNDLTYINQIYQTYKEALRDRIHFIRYEDLATKPIETMESVYQFLGLKPDDNVRHWAESLQQNYRLSDEEIINKSHEKHEGRYSTKREDPLYTSQAWRTKMSFSEVEQIQKDCKNFLYVFGYTVFQSENQLGNFSVSATQDVTVVL